MAAVPGSGGCLTPSSRRQFSPPLGSLGSALAAQPARRGDHETVGSSYLILKPAVRASTHAARSSYAFLTASSGQACSSALALCSATPNIAGGCLTRISRTWARLRLPTMALEIRILGAMMKHPRWVVYNPTTLQLQSPKNASPRVAVASNRSWRRCRKGPS